MSVFFNRLTIPSNTFISQPYDYDFEVPPALLEKITIVFPTGCIDLVGCWIEYRSARILPVNRDGYFYGNGTLLEYQTSIELYEPPHTVSVKCFNNDDTFDHSITIGLQVKYQPILAEIRQFIEVTPLSSIRPDR